MSTWQTMTQDERFYTIAAMAEFGGGFVSKLAAAWYAADSTNAERLGNAFPDLLDKYGPGTYFYRGVTPKEEA